MNHTLLVRICALLALLSFRTFGADAPVRPHDPKVRVVCGVDVPNDLRSTPIPDPFPPYFDVRMSLQKFSADISPQTFLDAVAEKTANRYTNVWIGFLSIFRWSAAEQKYINIERRLKLTDTNAFLNKLQDGDVLAFHGQACRF